MGFYITSLFPKYWNILQLFLKIYILILKNKQMLLVYIGQLQSKQAIKYSENEIITDFGNEIGPGIPRPAFNNQKICKKIHGTRAESTFNQLNVVWYFDILAAVVFIELWTGALQVQSCFQAAQVA